MAYQPPAPVRKFVKPSHALAKIPDLEHPGNPLTKDGREVNWSAHWARHEKQGNVRVFDTQADMDAFQPDDGDLSPDIPGARKVARAKAATAG